MKYFGTYCICLSTAACCVALFSCSDYEEKVIARWDDNTVKVRKIYSNRDTSKHVVVHYYPSGVMKEWTHYVNRIKEGWSVTYYENERVKDSTFFSNNIPVAASRQYHPNGELAAAGIYDDAGKRHGWWFFYDSLGRIMRKTDFVMDNEGQSFFFDSLGWMITTINMYGGEGIREEINFRDSIRHGQYKRYHPNGSIATAGEYHMGDLRDTEWTDFYPSGQIHMQYTFDGGSTADMKIISKWNRDGTQTIKNGEGKHVTYIYCETGKVRTKLIEYFTAGELVKSRTIKISSCL